MNIVEKLIKKNKVYCGSAIDLFCDKIELPNGAVAKREYLGHPGAAAVLPFISRKSIVLVKQYRYPINQITYEIPAGKIDKGETPLECITRELEEETGYRAKKLKKLLAFYPTAAFSNEIIHIFAAFGLINGEQNPDEDEFVSREIMSFKEAVKMVKTGKIKDSKTIIALLYFENILK
ncbi:NUDIX domain-containing protein [Candidatus Endomicrobiellum agilis]|uniref:NUDIX domain-containing protein n=1 Tax=Candidatus Endomicrobiellum agilis TaxID=3238957 RepID=UPI00358993C7|nr:NUDIX hydrolase [Endomicrobium sp.]